MKHFYAFVYSLVFLTGSHTIAQTSLRGTLQGKVSDEKGNPLPGASVFVHDVRILAIADTNGVFKTKAMTAGKYLVEVSYQGFATSIQQVMIIGDSHKDFVLNSTAVEQEAVTVTGVSSATRLKLSPQAVSLVKKSQLLQNASPNLMASLARQAGVSIITTGPAIAKPVIRGLGYNRVVTINDGIRQEGQQWGDEHGIEIDESSVQKAEILKGPASLMYGSDAMAGVINIITNQPITPGTIRGNVYASYTGNNHMQSYYADLAGHLHNGFNWNVYGSMKSATDYRNRYDWYVLNSRFDERNAGGYIGMNRPWGYSHLIVSSYNQKLGVPEGVRDETTGRFLIYAETPFESIATDEQLKNSVFITPYQKVNHFRIASDNSFSVNQSRVVATVAFQRNQRREYANPIEPTTPDLYFDLRTINYNFQLHLPQHSGWKMSFGVNGMYQQNQNKAAEKLIPEYSLFDAGAFGFATNTVNKLTLSGGVRADIRNMSITPLQESGVIKFNGFSRKYTNISGSIGIAYQLSGGVTVKGNIAKGYRAPNVAELSSNGAHEGTYRYEYGNNDLKVENSYQADAGLEVATNHVTFGITAFYNYVDNYIYYQRLQSLSGGDSVIMDNGVQLQAYKFNQATASLAGFEANFDIHPHPLDWLHIENTISFVAGSFSRPFDGSKNLPAMPPAKLLSEVRASFPKVKSVLRNFYAKVEMEATVKQDRVFTAYNTETPTPGYVLFNFGTGADFNHKNHTLFSLYFSANNITDVAYQNHLSRLKYTDVNNVTGRQGVYNMGRNFTLKLNIPINVK